MLEVKDNFKNKYKNDLYCDLCGKYEDQQHLLTCQILIDNCKALYDDSTVQYEDIFCTEVKQLPAVKLFVIVLEVRQKLLEGFVTRNNVLVQCTI